MKDIEEHIIHYSQSRNQFTLKELSSYLNDVDCLVPSATLYYRIDKLIENNKLSRIKKGLYSGVSLKPVYRTQITEQMQEVYSILRHDLPFADFCLYLGTEISQFQHNLASNNVLYIETNRDTCDSVFHILKRCGKTVFVRPDKHLINKYIDLSEPAIFVKPLVSESPVKKENNGMLTPSLEKILVDINADDDFFYLQGEETFYVFQNAYDRYSLNHSKLLRYARRRNLESFFKQFFVAYDK